MTITIGSLFSGIGGFDLAAERAGMDIRWSVEIDPVCRKVLARHWPHVQQYEDVCTVGAHNLERVDVIVFGSPCQDLSIAGRRAGFDGERSGLYHEAIRIIRELRPELIVWENVADALNSRRGRDFGIALDELANSGALDIGWRVLDARWFGVAQRRRRVFVVADFGGRRTEAILALSESLSWHPAPGREAGASIANALTGGSGKRGGPDDNSAQGNQLIPDLAPTLESGTNATGGTRPPGTTVDTAASLIPHLARALTAAGSSGSGYRMDGETDTLVVANTVTASAGHHGRSSPRGDGSDNLVLAFSSKNSGADATADLAPTMRAMNYDQSWLNGGGQLAVAVSLRSREGEATAEMGDEVSHALRSSKGGGDKPHVLAFDWQASAGNDTSWRGKGRQFIVRAGEQAGTLGASRVDAVMVTAPLPLYYTHDYNQDRVYDPAGVAPAVCAADSGGARNVLTSNGDEAGRNFSPAAVVRRLMPIECARLQGFPDDWIPSTIADSHHYRMLGNAVCVPVVEWLLRRLAAALEAS